MADEEAPTISFAETGEPILDQFSEEGFIDCTLQMVDHVSNEMQHHFRLVASHEGQSVGMNVQVTKGIRGGFDNDMNLIADHVYREGIVFSRSGPESDRLLSALASLYVLTPTNRRMVESLSFTCIALHQDDVDMEVEPIRIKLFGNDAEDCDDDDYFESFFNLDLSSGFVFWNEKDQDYRDPLIRGLSAPDSESE